MALNAQHQGRVEHMQQRLADSKHQNAMMQQKMVAMETHFRHQIREIQGRVSDLSPHSSRLCKWFCSGIF